MNDKGVFTRWRVAAKKYFHIFIAVTACNTSNNHSKSINKIVPEIQKKGHSWGE